MSNYLHLIVASPARRSHRSRSCIVAFVFRLSPGYCTNRPPTGALATTPSDTGGFLAQAALGPQQWLRPSQHPQPVAGVSAVCQAGECSVLPAARERLAGPALRWPEPSAPCAAEQSACPKSSVPRGAGTFRRRANIPRPSCGGSRSTTSLGCCRRSAISPSGSISSSFSCTR